jgi:hypothetical protein
VRLCHAPPLAPIGKIFVTRTVRRSAAFCALLSFAIAGCQRSVPASPDEGQRLALGTPATGEITSGNRLNFSDGTRTALFRLDLEPGEAIAIEAGASFCGRLALYSLDADGRQVFQGPAAEGGCIEKDGRLVQTRSRVSPEGGRYLLAFSGREPGDFGPYRVSVSPLKLDEDRDLVAGDEVAGLWSTEKTVALKVAEVGQYQIDFRSAEFDPTLKLEGQGVSRENDDDGEGTDARLTAFLQPGDYRLTLGRVGGNGGVYRLSVLKKEGGVGQDVELQNGGDLPTGRDVNGVLQGEPATYQLVLAERARVTLALGSDDFDTRLDLSGEGVRMSDDDSGDDTDSRLVTLLEPGSYTVTAFDLGEENAGLFTLSAAVAPASGAMPALAAGVPQQGSLAVGEQRRYRLSVPAPASYVLTMQSSDVDSVLHVLRDGVLIGSDDDGGDNTDSRLEVDLEPGDYDVVATTLGGDGGNFRIQAAIR